MGTDRAAMRATTATATIPRAPRLAAVPRVSTTATATATATRARACDGAGVELSRLEVAVESCEASGSAAGLRLLRESCEKLERFLLEGVG